MAEARIEGLDGRTARQVARYFNHVSGELPVRRSIFERALMLSSDLAGVDIRSEFSVPDRTSGAKLRLVGSQARQAGAVTFNTVPIAGGNSRRLLALQQFTSLAAGGDLLRVYALGTRETADLHSLVGNVYYRAPLGSRGAYVEARGGNTFVERRFRDLDVSSNAKGADWAAGVGYPLVRNFTTYVYAIGEYDRLRLDQNGLGALARSRSVAGRAMLVFGRNFSSGGVMQLSTSVSSGTSEQTPATETPTGRFSHLRLAFGSLVPLGGRTSQRFEIYAQPLATRLPFVEHVFLGMGQYLRGYTPIEFSGERGVKGTAEISHALIERAAGRVEFAPFAFVDAGYAVNPVMPAGLTRRDMTLASAGGGVRARVGGGVSGEFWAARALRQGSATERGDVKAGVMISKGW
ncbi:MAG: hypothetical protein RLZZ53_2891 [Acidobacteriota bacterium]